MKTIVTAFIVVILLSACASLPKPGELARLDKVRFGEKIPENKDFILYFEAGQEIPLTVLVDGNLFEKTADQRMSVVLKKTIYAYKEWTSFDGIHWVKGNNFLDLNLVVKIPGYHYPKPGLIHLTLDEKKQ